MKKIITTLLLSLLLLVGYTQDAAYARATTLNVGVKNTLTGDFDWSGPKVIESILVMIEPTVITINSTQRQHYTIYSDSEDVEVEGSAVYWYAYDTAGQRCRLYLIENESGEDFLAIEYNDFAWIYNLIPLK
jgi:hypothetical protein